VRSMGTRPQRRRKPGHLAIQDRGCSREAPAFVPTCLGLADYYEELGRSLHKEFRGFT
jgi:hypothetical protein